MVDVFKKIVTLQHYLQTISYNNEYEKQTKLPETFEYIGIIKKIHTDLNNKNISISDFGNIYDNNDLIIFQKYIEHLEKDNGDYNNLLGYFRYLSNYRPSIAALDIFSKKSILLNLISEKSLNKMFKISHATLRGMISMYNPSTHLKCYVDFMSDLRRELEKIEKEEAQELAAQQLAAREAAREAVAQELAARQLAAREAEVKKTTTAGALPPGGAVPAPHVMHGMVMPPALPAPHGGMPQAISQPGGMPQVTPGVIPLATQATVPPAMHDLHIDTDPIIRKAVGELESDNINTMDIPTSHEYVTESFGYNN